MRQEPNDRKHLTPRQIVNRYLKGEYVDESIEAISSAISSCNKTFDSVTIPFPSNLMEKAYDNIEIAKAFYECRKAGKSADDIAVPDYPQLKELLMDLAYPPLWECMKEKTNTTFIEIMKEQGFNNKYHVGFKNIHKVTTIMDLHYSDAVKQVGLSNLMLSLVLDFMLG